MKYYYIAFILLMGTALQAQDFDTTYLSNIRSVRFHLAGLPLSYPIIDLGSNSALVLSFDDLEGDVKDFTYTLEHCNADWKRSKLMELEYLKGYSEDRIRNNESAFNTTIPYTHYTLQLPNENMQWTKSGNYILRVFLDEDDKVPAITKRFIVVESLVKVMPELKFPAVVEKMRTHQEIDFKVNYKGLSIANQQQEIKATILQNGVWQTAVSGIAPQFYPGEEVMNFDFQDKIVFPAGKEYRYFDMRSFMYRLFGVRSIDDYDGNYHLTLYTDKSLGEKAYLSRTDLNGNYITGFFDNDVFTFESYDLQVDSDSNIFDKYASDDGGNEAALESDYAEVTFSLECFEPQENADVYIYGALSDWELTPRCRMTYDEASHAYIAKLLLKQGFYNYKYALLPKGSSKPDFETFEGDWHETENNYTILIYYRPFGARYDRPIAAHTFNTLR